MSNNQMLIKPPSKPKYNKETVKKISTFILCLSVVITVIMMIACGTLLVAQFTDGYVAYQEFSKQAYITMMVSYLVLLLVAFVNSKIQESDY